MFFAMRNLLTLGFNTASRGVQAGTVLGLANDKNNDGQGVEKTMKAAAKMFLMGGI
jgi:hypothetical protein